MANSTTIKFDQIIGDIERRKFSPVYLLEGEETYFIDALATILEEKILKPEEKSFNQIITYGKDISALEIKMAAKRYPMMADYQLILVREAQNLNDLEALEDYLENPTPTTILVLCYKGKKLDKRTKYAKLFAKYTQLTSERLRDYEVMPWVEKYLRNKGRSIEPKALQLISDYLGNDLGKITNEIDKMLINVKADVGLIGMQHIEQNIGISKDFNIFELQKALGDKNFNKSVQIANYFASNPKANPIIPIIANLYGYFAKVYACYSIKNKTRKEVAIALGLNEFFVQDYITAANNYPPHIVEHIFGLLKYFDLRSKGINDSGNTDDGQLIIEMIVKILRSAEVPAHLKIM
ncbi:MAG: DNA polymerase III subunit delta [Bacteroidetes bacterium]|nr:DNA polymerase III subunit delta [Bacteroidota bacterium]